MNTIVTRHACNLHSSDETLEYIDRVIDHQQEVPEMYCTACFATSALIDEASPREGIDHQQSASAIIDLLTRE